MVTYRQPFSKEWPVTQGYGEKITSQFHTGIDYGCPLNTSILASAEGQVVFAGWDSTGYGNMVIVQHTQICSTLYAHLSDISVKLGQKVRQGELLGHSGTTGNSTGPHLHFEARMTWNDYKTHFDPMTLPLMTVDDSIPAHNKPSLAAGHVRVSAPSGVFAHMPDFSDKTILPYGSKLNFTGKTVERNGLTFCECTLWIADNDGQTQLLENC